MDFGEKLKAVGLNKSKLALRLGLNPRTVSTWGNSPPRYVEAFLELLIENRNYANLKELLGKLTQEKS